MFFFKVRHRKTKKYLQEFHLAATKIWEIYKSENLKSFGQRIRRLREWADKERTRF